MLIYDTACKDTVVYIKQICYQNVPLEPYPSQSPGPLVLMFCDIGVGSPINVACGITQSYTKPTCLRKTSAKAWEPRVLWHLGFACISMQIGPKWIDPTCELKSRKSDEPMKATSLHEGMKTNTGTSKDNHIKHIMILYIYTLKKYTHNNQKNLQIYT